MKNRSVILFDNAVTAWQEASDFALDDFLSGVKSNSDFNEKELWNNLFSIMEDIIISRELKESLF